MFAHNVDMTGDSFNEDQIMVQEDGTLFNVPPTKRKQKKDKGKATPGLSKKLTIEDETTSDSERDFSEWSLPERLVPDGQGRQGYSLDQVRTFLERTKGKRDVVVEDYFPNRLLLIGTVRKLIRQKGGDGLLQTEVYRLWKLVRKLQKNDEDEWPNSKQQPVEWI